MFGFSWRPTCFGLKTSFLSLGFPWISLDSLVRIETFQWVTRGFRGKNFSPAFPHGAARRRDGSGGRGHTEARNCSCGELTGASDFLQAIVVRAVAFRPRRFKSNLLQYFTRSKRVFAKRPGEEAANVSTFVELNPTPQGRLLESQWLRFRGRRAKRELSRARIDASRRVSRFTSYLFCVKGL
jgi:hypothetical protein